jgi:PEP-CTERM motif
MKKVLLFGSLLAILCFGFAGVATADTCPAASTNCLASGGVTWTFTSGGQDGSGGFLVNLTVNASSPDLAAGTSLFSVMALQFTNAGSSATSISSVTTSANTSGWAFAGPGNVNHCGTGNLPFLCVMTATGITFTGGSNSGIYTFQFDVKGITGAPTSADLQEGQGSLPGSNGKYNLSDTTGIGGPPTTTPEPASMLLLGLGLAGAPFLRRRKA